MLPAGIVYRPKTDADRPFLSYVYATTRADEMSLVSWTAQQKAEFLEKAQELQKQGLELKKQQAAEQAASTAAPSPAAQ